MNVPFDVKKCARISYAATALGLLLTGSTLNSADPGIGKDISLIFGGLVIGCGLTLTITVIVMLNTKNRVPNSQVNSGMSN